MEEWKIITDYPMYSVSSHGNVKNNKTDKFRSLSKNSTGYLNVGLFKNKKQSLFKVHRLVAIAFIPNPEGKPCVDHINNCKTDNNVSNLRWATITENRMNSSQRSNNKSGVKGVHYNKHKQKWIAEIRINGKKTHIGVFDTIKDATDARRSKCSSN